MKQKWSPFPFELIAIVLITLLASSPAEAVSTTVVIGEFRTRGPMGGNDEFVEIYNLSASPVDISGWKLNASNSAGTTGTRATVPTGTTLSAYQHYLFANNNASGGYSASTVPNQSYGVGITDDGGIALLDPSNAIIDQVGMSAGSAYKEGTVLAATTGNLDQSYARLPNTLSQTGGHKNGVDTDNNSADFLFNATSSSPENTGSPLAVTLRTLSASNNASDRTVLIALALATVVAILVIRRRSRAL